MADTTNTHEGLETLDAQQVQELGHVVSETDAPHRDPVTGKLNEDVPTDELGVSDAAKEHREDLDADLQRSVDSAEEAFNANQMEDPYLEDTVDRHDSTPDA